MILSELFKKADKALYQTKREGRSGVTVFGIGNQRCSIKFAKTGKFFLLKIKTGKNIEKMVS